MPLSWRGLLLDRCSLLRRHGWAICRRRLDVLRLPLRRLLRWLPLLLLRGVRWGRCAGRLLSPLLPPVFILLVLRNRPRRIGLLVQLLSLLRAPLRLTAVLRVACRLLLFRCLPRGCAGCASGGAWRLLAPLLSLLRLCLHLRRAMRLRFAGVLILGLLDIRILHLLLCSRRILGGRTRRSRWRSSRGHWLCHTRKRIAWRRQVHLCIVG